MLKLRFPIPIFRSAKEIVNGKNARMALKGLVTNKAALIISPSFRQSTYFEQIVRLINTDCVCVIDKSWQGEPTSHELKETIYQLEQEQPDYIVALGGGSIIDGAKLAWLHYECGTIDHDTLFKPFAISALRGKAQFAAIPTTIGAGSEVSSAAVILDEQSRSKKAVVTHDFLPDLVILDPELVSEVPKAILKLTLADALSHAVEGYVSKVSHPMMESFAEKSVEIIHRYRNIYPSDAWDLDMISNLQQAAMFGGWVQNHCLVGLSHAIAHQLGYFGVPHALANAALMPRVIQFNAQADEVKLKYQTLIHRAGLQDMDELLALFEILIAGQHLSPEFNEADFSFISENAMLDPAAKVNPVRFNQTDVIEVLKQCL